MKRMCIAVCASAAYRSRPISAQGRDHRIRDAISQADATGTSAS
jgi:hypothetical protein